MDYFYTYTKYIAHMDDELLAFYNSYTKVYIYGAGRFGCAMRKYLCKRKCNVSGFVVTDVSKEKGEAIDGLPVVGIEEIEELCRAGEIGIIIGVSPAFRQEISFLLKEKGIINVYQPDVSLLEHVFHDGRTLSYEEAIYYKEKYPITSVESVRLSAWNSILVVSINNIGDVIMQVPFLRGLRKSCSSSTKITMIVQPTVALFLKHSGYVDELIVFNMQNQAVDAKDCEKFVCNFASKHLSGKKFDVVISLGWYYVLLEQTFLTLVSGAPIRIAYSEHGFPEKSLYNKNNDLLQSLVINSPKPEHEVRKNLHMLEVLGGKADSDKLEFWMSEEDVLKVEDFFNTERYLRGKRLIAVAPHANAQDRMWNINNYLELLQRISKAYDDVVFIVFGGDGAKQLTDVLEKSHVADRLVNLIGKTSIGVMAGILKRCCLYIGCNTGPVHIAAAWGVSTVEIIPHPMDGNPAEYTSPLRYKAWGNKSYVVRPRTALPGCGGSCYARKAHCIEQITVEEAFAEVQKAMKNI